MCIGHISRPLYPWGDAYQLEIISVSPKTMTEPLHHPKKIVGWPRETRYIGAQLHVRAHFMHVMLVLSIRLIPWQ